MRLFSRRRPKADELQELYRQHGPALLLYATSILERRHAAEDVLQQVFMEMLEQNTIPEEPRPYLFRAVRNRALNLMRHERQNAPLTEIQPWFETKAGDPALEVALRSGLRALGEEQRQAVILHLWGGLSFAEIAAVLEIPANTAASRYRYALQRLRSLMRAEDSPCR